IAGATRFAFHSASTNRSSGISFALLIAIAYRRKRREPTSNGRSGLETGVSCRRGWALSGSGSGWSRLRLLACSGRVRYIGVAMSEWRKYRWALHVELSPVGLPQLPGDAYAGYEYARDLAVQAPIGRGQNLHDLPQVELTIDDVAEREHLLPHEINR